MKDIDLYDKKILCELDLNARISASKLGKKINLPKESVNYRIKNLIKKGIISYIYTLINASMFGYNYYRVSIKLDKHTKEIEKKILDFLFKEPSCTNIRLTDGTFNLVFLAQHENARDFRVFLSALGKILANMLLIEILVK